MSCNYCWNQPKKYERYDLYLDGKIKADDFVYRTKDESGEISTTTLSEKIDEIESRLQTHFTFKHVEKLPTEGEETVIYLVPNAETSGDKDGYDEYMWVKKDLQIYAQGWDYWVVLFLFFKDPPYCSA